MPNDFVRNLARTAAGGRNWEGYIVKVPSSSSLLIRCIDSEVIHTFRAKVHMKQLWELNRQECKVSNSLGDSIFLTRFLQQMQNTTSTMNKSTREILDLLTWTIGKTANA